MIPLRIVTPSARNECHTRDRPSRFRNATSTRCWVFSVLNLLRIRNDVVAYIGSLVDPHLRKLLFIDLPMDFTKILPMQGYVLL